MQTTTPSSKIRLVDLANKFDNNLKFPPPGAIKITSCESNTVIMNTIQFGKRPGIDTIEQLEKELEENN